MTKLRWVIVAACGLAMFATLGSGVHAADKKPAEDKAMLHARELLKKVILIDGHNDLPWVIRDQQEELQRRRRLRPGGRRPRPDRPGAAQKGGVGAQFWSV